MARTRALGRRRSSRPRGSPTGSSAAARARRSSPRTGRRGGFLGCSLPLFFWTLLLAPLGLFVLIWFAAPARATTFLILGTDQRPGERQPARTDVIMLAQVDPAANRAVLVSIPRDLWLTQPSGVANRINTATVLGDDPTDRRVGPRTTVATLQSALGVPLAGYLLINFRGFVDLVDAVNGVIVEVPYPLVDHSYPTEDYGTTTIQFETGSQQMDGERALIYVRTRHQDGDFGRAQRQQQLFRALASRLFQPSTWPRVAAVFLHSVQSDISPLRWPTLFQLSVFAALGRLETLVLDQGYTAPWRAPDGAAVLLPNWERIRPALEEILAAAQ